MSHKPAQYILAVLLIVLSSFSSAGCFVSPECDPESDEYDPNECDDFTLYDALLLNFTTAIYGGYGNWFDHPFEEGSCPGGIRCLTPYCKRVEQNGSFSRGEVGASRDISPWSGDSVVRDVDNACSGRFSIRLVATTPAGPSNSRSSQLYQVIDLAQQLPPDLLPNWRRTRAHAIFHSSSDDDRRFGLHLAAFTGDPDAFPEGDYETFSQNTPAYTRVAFTENFFQVDRAEGWEGFLTEMMLPINTDFIVVILEAYEEGQNDSTGEEFSGNMQVDEVKVALDAGPSPPVAGDDEATTNEDMPVNIRVLRNDIDVDGSLDPATLTITNSPDNGGVTVSADGVVTYEPEENFFGTDFFTYVIADDQGQFSGLALVTVTIRPVNDAPTAFDNSYARQGANTLVVGTPGVLGNDSDVENNVLTAVLVDDVDNGALSLSVDGSFTYNSDPGFLGTDSFTYVANDGTDDSNEATVTIELFVQPNQPPTAGDDQAQTIAETPTIINVLINDSDIDGALDPATVTVTIDPSDGAVEVLPNGTIRYTPNANFAGFDQFKYTVQDNDGAVSNEATVDVEVIG